MPIKSGKATYRETIFAEHYAATGDRVYSATKAGYAVPASGASQALMRPEVQAEIRRVQVQRLYSEALPAAVDCVLSIIRDERAPAGARVQAAKVVFDRTLGLDESFAGKEPHEMTPDELERARQQLLGELANRAKVVDVDPAPNEAASGVDSGTNAQPVPNLFD